MTTIERALITFVAASLGLALAVSAVGAETVGAKLRATAYKPIPVDSALSLKTADNSDLTMQMREVMRAELQRNGYRISDGSPLVLTIGTHAPPSLDDDQGLPMKVAGGNDSIGMRFKLIGTNSSGLLQDSPAAPAEDYQISLSVRDGHTDEYLWRGVANICQCGQGILAASRQIAPELADAIGRTIGPQPVAFETLQ